MPEILQLSDLHFGKVFLPARAEAARALAARLTPDVVVISGDLTQRARKAQFEAARAYLSSLAAPVVVTPGNHDLPVYRVLERLVAPYRNYRRTFEGGLDAVHRFAGFTVVALNSTRPYRVTGGRLTAGQLERTARAFADSPAEDFRIVVTHHHVASPPRFGGARAVAGATGAVARFAELGVRLLMTGHLHATLIGDPSSLMARAARGRGGRLVIAQCGTTSSTRGRGPERGKNSLNYIQLDRDATVVTHYMWDEVGRVFTPHREYVFGEDGAVRWELDQRRSVASRR